MRTHITETGAGRVTTDEGNTHLHLPPVTADTYHNAQVASYVTRQEMDYKPPLRLSLRAWAEGRLHGTAGFGFWNHPYDPAAGLLNRVRLPRALWFFHSSPPNYIPLALNAPGYGWKCGTFNADNWRFLSLLPMAPLGFLLMRFPLLYRRLWPIGQSAIGVSEATLNSDMIYHPHEYSLEWHRENVVFRMDGEVVHMARHEQSGPLGFVAWLDNQYAIVTPQGRFGSGLVSSSESQSLHIEGLQITT